MVIEPDVTRYIPNFL